MRVLHFNTDDWGGAARSCIRLHNELLKENIESDILTLFRKNENYRTHSFFNEGNPMNSIKGFIKSVPSPLINRINMIGRKFNDEMFSRPHSSIDLTEHPFYQTADVIHLHWVAHFLDYESFFRKNKKPVIWTFRDSNSFTGGCHVHLDCRGFEGNCKNCPQLDGNWFSGYASGNLKFKRGLFKTKYNLNIVTPSEWLKEESLKSRIYSGFTHTVIPNFVDSNIFNVKGKEECRKKLNLPSEKNILLFLSSGVNKAYKGFPILREVLSKLNNKDVMVISVGGIIKDKPDTENFYEFGFIDLEEKLSDIYNASDVFVNPSFSESFSNTTLESLLCGTPVIGFNRTAIPELIKDKENGLLVKDTNHKALNNAIDVFFKGDTIFERVKIGNETSVKYSSGQSVKKYIDLYRSIISDEK